MPLEHPNPDKKSKPMCICCFACVWSFRLDQELHKRFSYCKNALWCKHSAQDVLFLCLTAWGHVPSQSLIMSLALFSVRYSKEAALWPALAHTWHLFSVFIRLFSINVWPLWRCEEFWDALPSSVIKMWPWTTKPVISSTGIFVAIANNTLCGSKLLIFLLCQKSLGY